MTETTTSGSRAAIVVALKWVDLWPDVDRLTGAVHHDDRFFGCSAADQAALEWALRIGDAWDLPIIAITAGPPAAESLLRDALAAGATSVLRIDLPAGVTSERVAARIADAVVGGHHPDHHDHRDVALVCCGDWSLDRGSGSVPAFLSAELGWGQALGLVGLEVGAEPTDLTVSRRLDGGRREVLAVTAPTVLSFEGGTASLRRASLTAVLRATDALVPVWSPSAEVPSPRVTVTHRGPDRPRAHALPPPDLALTPRERILSLTGALVEHTPPRTVMADPDEAAELIVDQLQEWGYLPPA